ncbi:MAG: hypothetical protein ABI775_12165, partial [Pseudonocardiales bacterium]
NVTVPEGGCADTRWTLLREDLDAPRSGGIPPGGCSAAASTLFAFGDLVGTEAPRNIRRLDVSF